MYDDCIEWTGRRMKTGYGVLSIGSRTILAHRQAWEQANGPIPEGLVIRHRCDNPPCVNPDHLEVGTQADNVRDMVERGRHRGNGNELKTECRSGHPFTPANTYVNPAGERACRICRLEQSRKYEATRRRRKRAA